MALLCQIQLQWMDYGLIVAYALLVLAIGFGFSRQQASSANFLLAGRSMGWVSVGISQLASLLSAISYLGTPGEAYGYDLQYLLFSICGFLCVPLAVYLFLDFFYRLKVTSIYEYLERRFNFPTRLLASAVFIISRLAWMATIVVAVSLAIEELTGIEPAVSIILTTAVATAYTLVGGMKAIIWTDVLQFFLFTLGLAAAVALIFWKDPASELLAVMVRDDKLRMFNFSLDATTRITVWMAVTAGAVNGVANLTDQVSMQRYLSCGSLRDARRAVWFKPFLSIPVTVLIYGLGLALYAHHQLNPELAVGIGSADRAFPHFVLNEMHGGLAGLILAAIFAAAMSSIDSGTHTISTVCVEDYYKRLIRPDAPDSHCLRLARGLTLIWAVVIAVLAQFLTGQDTIVGTMATVAAPVFRMRRRHVRSGNHHPAGHGLGNLTGSAGGLRPGAGDQVLAVPDRRAVAPAAGRARPLHRCLRRAGLQVLVDLHQLRGHGHSRVPDQPGVFSRLQGLAAGPDPVGREGEELSSTSARHRAKAGITCLIMSRTNPPVVPRLRAQRTGKNPASPILRRRCGRATPWPGFVSSARAPSWPR